MDQNENTAGMNPAEEGTAAAPTAAAANDTQVARDTAAPTETSSTGKDSLLSRIGKRIRRITSEYGYLLIPAGVAAALFFLLYLARGLYPFGDGCVLVLDLNGQYEQFYQALRHVLHGDASFLYTFCKSMGGEFLGLYDYYVASPFACLVALFPQTMMLEALLVLFLFKAGLMAFNMGFYLHKISRGQPNKVGVMIFSILYALSSYAVIQQHNSMWIDCMLWLPILTYGIEELIKRGHFRLYVFALSISLISNFYIGYMMCIYTAVYCVYYYFAHNDRKNPGNNPGGESYHLAKSFGRVAVWSLLAIGIAALTVLSARYSLGLGKSDFSTPDWTVKQRFPLSELFFKLLPSSYDTVRPEGLPVVYCGVLTLMLVPAFFLARKISNREKVAAAFLLLFFVASFATSSLDLIWHGFQKPNWLNYRYSFMFCFILLVLAFRAFEQIQFISRKALLGVTASLGVLILLLQQMLPYMFTDMRTVLVNKHSSKTEMFEKWFDRPFAMIWLALGCLFVYFILICLSGRVKKKKETISSILVFVVCVEVFVSALFDMNAFDNDVMYGSHSKYTNYMKTVLPITQTLEEYDDGFYRAEKTFYRKMNDNFTLQLKGLSSSASTMNRPGLDFQVSMGYAGGSYWSKYLGGNPVNDSFFGVKYIISENDLSAYYGEPVIKNEVFREQYSEKLIESWSAKNTPSETKSASKADIYLNPYALSMVFGVADDFADFEIFTVNAKGKRVTLEGNSIEQINQMLTAMLGEEQTVEVFKKATLIGTPELVNCTSTSSSGHDKYEGVDVDKEASVTFTYDVPADLPVFLYYASDYTREVKVSVNKTSKGGFDGDSDSTRRYIHNLGIYSADDVKDGLNVTLTMTKTKISGKDKKQIYIKQEGRDGAYGTIVYYLDWDLFRDVVDRLNQVHVEFDAKSTDDHLYGSVTTTAAGQLMASSISYDDGWHVYVDGKEVETIQAADSLLAFRIDGAGEHSIELKYMPSSIKLGIICSITCTIIFVLLVLAWPWIRKIPLIRCAVEIPGSEPVPEESYDLMYARALYELRNTQDGLQKDDIGMPSPDVAPTDPNAPEDADERRKATSPKAGKNPAKGDGKSNNQKK